MPRAAEDQAAAPATTAASGRLEVRLSGSGGQGILLAAALLADAALAGGRSVVQTQSYGPEARGGASKAEVVIADGEIDYPEVRSPQVTLCLSQAAFDKYGAAAPPGSTLYYDSGLVEPRDLPGVAAFGAAFTDLSLEKLGKTVVANIVALTAMVADARLAVPDDLKAAIRRRVPARFEELNLQAFELGLGLELTPPSAVAAAE